MTPRHASPLEMLLVDPSFDGDVSSHESMSAHTTYRIGGPARYFVRVDSIGSLTKLVGVCKDQGIDWTVVGKGSNLLVSDDGYDGVVICLGRDFKDFRQGDEEGSLISGAGVALSKVVQRAFDSSLSGLEFAVGTPGTVGGAIRMNAGSAKEYIGECVASVTILDGDGTLRRLLPGDIEWGYRRTSLKSDEIVLECELELTPGDPFYIRGRMEANLARRKSAQPLDKPSCGSVFKNPEGLSAAKLIDDLGLKGTTIGGAQVSNTHANFIVNTGGASAKDVCDLIALVRDKVKDSHGIELSPEVRFLGF